MNTLEGATKQHVQNCCPKNALEAAKVADIYFENRPKSQKNFSASHRKKFNAEGYTKNMEGSSAGQSANPPMPPSQKPMPGGQATAAAPGKGRNGCFICQETTHKQAACPFKTQHQPDSFKFSGSKQAKRPGFVKAKTRRILSKYEIPVVVNGQKLIGYRDTGSTMSFVKERLFPTLERTGSVSIYGINDRQAVEVPTALVKITSPIFDNSEEAVVEVGLLPYMKWHVLLGNDAFENNGLRDILQVHNKMLINSEGNDAHASATERGQSDNNGDDVRNFQNGRGASQTPNDEIDTNSPQPVLRGECARADIDETIDSTAHQHSNLVGENGNRLLAAKATTRSARNPTLQRSDGADIITVTSSDNAQKAVTVTTGNRNWAAKLHSGSNNPPAGHRDPVGGRHGRRSILHRASTCRARRRGGQG